ncbi:MAG: cytidine deaminase [Defluviitaleaceae bacterium]|nr:cytidine deaminase [Defluviitaleaceae bacterium]
MDKDFEFLLSIATDLAKIKKRLNRHVKMASVACALMSENRNIYTGVNIEVDCGIGFCAEHSAIAEMIKNDENKIYKLVAVRQSIVIQPCGRCREFIRLINFENLNALILMPEGKILKLKELLPYPFLC